MHSSAFSLLSCTVLALFASSALAQSLTPPATPVGGCKASSGIPLSREMILLISLCFHHSHELFLPNPSKPFRRRRGLRDLAFGPPTHAHQHSQDLCSRVVPGSKLGTTFNSDGKPTCSCLTPSNPGTECSNQGIPDAGQIICLVGSTFNSGDQQLSRFAKCGVCSRRAGSPGARSIQ